MKMLESSRTTFMTPKSSKTTQLTSITNDKLSEIPIKTSLCNHIRRSWLIIVLSFVSVAGITGTIGIALVSFVFLTTTTLSTSTTTTTTTTTATMCFTISTPRPSNVWLVVGTMATGRIEHTSTLISQDNSVLIVGGHSGSITVSSVEKYIPSTGCFQSMRDMPRTRYYHTADQLSSLSGYVLIAGGYSTTAGALSVADLYHPITGDIITIPLTMARYRHSSTVLSSSRLVLIGGYNSSGISITSSDMIDTALNSSFAAGTNTMTEAHVFHSATVLGSNSSIALIAGGFGTSGYVATAYLFHGISNAFVSLGSGVTMSPARAYHAATYLPSPINKILITGGYNGAALTALVLFDVSSLTFSTLTTTLIHARYYHIATLLPNGKVLIIGGFNGGSLRTCELIDPSNNYTVTSAGNLNTNRYYHTANLLTDSNSGTVFVCGGYNAAAVPSNTCELYVV